MSDLHTLSGVYAVDALTPEEAELFEQHMAECQACRDEVRELREAAAVMGAVEAVPPPAGLKARVLAAADREPQLPPRVDHLTATRGRPRLARFLAAAAAVVFVVTAGVTVAQLQQSDEGPRDPVAVVAQAPDARTTRLETSNGGTVTVSSSEQLGQLAIDTDRLPALTQEQVYQLWEIADGQAKSAGLVEDIGTGKTLPLPAPGTQVAMTIEPAGGSEQPTSDPIVAMTPSEQL